MDSLRKIHIHLFWRNFQYININVILNVVFGILKGKLYKPLGKNNGIT